MLFAPRRSPAVNNSVNRGWAALLIATPPSWPTARNLVAAVYTAAAATPFMLATSTMSIRARMFWAVLAIPRGIEKAQNPRGFALASLLLLTLEPARFFARGPPSDDSEGVASAMSAAISGGTADRSPPLARGFRWICRSHSQAAIAHGMKGAAHSGARRAALPTKTAARMPAIWPTAKPSWLITFVGRMSC